MKRFLSNSTLLRIFLTVVFTAAVASSSFAQSLMTDEQIIEFAMAEREAGSTDQQIALKLMKQGVSIQKMQELRDRLSGMEQSAAPGSSIETTGPADYSRKSNMDEVKEIIQERPEPKDSVVRIFGHDIFNKNTITFEPNMNIATPADYRLGAGDVVFIEVFGATQKTIQGQISPDGNVTIPDLGPVHLAGLTVGQANARIRSQLGAQYASSRIQLYVGQTKTIMVQVMGEVNYPGTYTLSAFASVFHALYMAGGPNDIGTLRTIKVVRDGAELTTVDVYDYIFKGELSGNVKLADNDVIIVSPYNSLVRIAGNVKRPMFYEMRQDESLKTLLAYAGGFTGDAYRDEVSVFRNTGVEKSIFSVAEDEMTEFRMADRDSVFVGKILDRFNNRVVITGEVFRPGPYQIGGRINTVRDLLNAAQGVTEVAFAEHAVLHRRRADRTLEAYSINLSEILAETSPDMALQKDDELFVPRRQDMMEKRVVTIHGEVFRPGEYPYAEKQTIENLIMLAGGLTDLASTQRVDVSRRIIDPNAAEKGSVKAEWFTFSLQNGFIVSGDAGFELKPYDNVFVRRSPMSNSQENVSISGKVQFAGNYSLVDNNMRLSDLVKMAGGPTIGAYTHGARLLRVINEDERERMQEILDKVKSDYAKMEMEDKSSSTRGASALDYSEGVKNFELGNTYYVGIELDKALANPGSDFDVLLREGDKLIVPEYTGTVTISGEVMQKNSVAYLPGKNLKYYLEQAGGYTQYAKKNRAYIVHMNGTISKAKGNAIEPGCEIVVPMKSQKAKASITEIMSIGSASASIAAMIATIANLVKK